MKIKQFGINRLKKQYFQHEAASVSVTFHRTDLSTESTAIIIIITIY